jgi:hypothetical protein
MHAQVWRCVLTSARSCRTSWPPPRSVSSFGSLFLPIVVSFFLSGGSARFLCGSLSSRSVAIAALTESLTRTIHRRFVFFVSICAQADVKTISFWQQMQGNMMGLDQEDALNVSVDSCCVFFFVYRVRGAVFFLDACCSLLPR